MLTRPEYSDFVRSRVKWLATPQEDLVHAAVGLIGELVELEAAVTTENAREEAGDCEFYLEHAYLAIERIQFDNGLSSLKEKEGTLPGDMVNPLAQYRQVAALLLDMAKKAWIYGKPLEAMPLPAVLGLCVSASQRLLRHNGWEIQRIRHENYEKLLRRYPKGYSNEAAQARADKANGET